MTKDLNPLEPKILEFKFFAPGVGPVLAVSVSGAIGSRGADQLQAAVGTDAED